MMGIAKAASAPADRGFVVYERKRGWAALDLRELWAYRELLYFLTWRDILVRYKQAVLGVAWAILQPLLTMVVFTVVFNKALGIAEPRPPTSPTRSSASPGCCRGSSSPERCRAPA